MVLAFIDEWRDFFGVLLYRLILPFSMFIQIDKRTM